MMQNIRVMLVDDQEIIRQGMETILRYAPGIEVVGQAANGQEAVVMARTLGPDVVLMDIKMPVLGGIPATRTITQERPRTRVIILTTYDTDDLVFEGIKAGAQGYLLKDAGSQMLVEAIHGVMRDESQIDPRVAHKVLNEFQRMAAEREALESRAGILASRSATGKDDLILERLSTREEEVLQLLVEGLSNREIGAQLHLTEGTVKNHVSAVISKLQANDRTQAVVTALRRGLVDL
ncbi:MAG: response regulator transcription factor [Anaerolineae bacterium]